MMVLLGRKVNQVWTVRKADVDRLDLQEIQAALERLEIKDLREILVSE